MEPTLVDRTVATGQTTEQNVVRTCRCFFCMHPYLLKFLRSWSWQHDKRGFCSTAICSSRIELRERWQAKLESS